MAVVYDGPSFQGVDRLRQPKAGKLSERRSVKVVCSELENTQGRVWVAQKRKRVRYSVREE